MLTDTEVLMEQPSLQQAPSAVKKRGVFVLALGCVGALCFVGQRFGQREDVSWTSRLVETRRSILKAFENRSLSDNDHIIKEEFNFAFKPKGAELKGMEISSVLSADKEYKKGAHPYMSVTFKAQEGKSKDLLATLKKVKRSLVEKFDLPPELVDMNRSVYPPGVTIKFLYDEATGVSFSPDDVSFKFSMKFGRTFEEMFDNGKDTVLEVPGGIEGKMNSALATSLLLPFSGPGPYGLIQPINEVRATEDVYYIEGGFDSMGLPSLSQATEMMAMQLKQILKHSPDLHDAVLTLPDFADGIDSMRIAEAGLLFEIKFKHFHLTPVMKKVVSR